MPPRVPPQELKALTTILLFLGLGLICSCAAAPKRPESPAKVHWREFIKNREALRERVEAIDIKASVNLATPERKTRLVVNFWGNLDYPLRLDLTTGFGAPVAFSREDGSGFTAFDPGAKTAFVSESGRRGALILGLAMPFDLRDLAALAAGDFPALLPETYSRAEPAGDGWRYEFSGNSDIVSATLDARGRLAVLAGTHEERRWTLSLSDYAEENAPGESRPGKLVFEAGEDVKAILRIKDMRRMTEKWPHGALELALPPGARVRMLDP